MEGKGFIIFIAVLFSILGFWTGYDLAVPDTTEREINDNLRREALTAQQDRELCERTPGYLGTETVCDWGGECFLPNTRHYTNYTNNSCSAPNGIRICACYTNSGWVVTHENRALMGAE